MTTPILPNFYSSQLQLETNSILSTMTEPIEANLPLLSALATLRTLLPAFLLGILILRFSVKAFLALMDRIQAQGWIEEEGEAMFNPISPPIEEEDVIHPVVVKVSSKRRGLILSLFAVVAMTYFAEGAAQIIGTLISNEFTPDSPIFENIIPYVLGSFSAFVLCPLAMNYEERLAKKEGAWGVIYPRMIVFLALCIETAIVTLLAIIIKNDPSTQSSILPAIDLGLIAFRLLILVFSLLSQTPLLYKSKFVPWSKLNENGTATSEESTSLLGSNGTTAYGTTEVAPTSKQPSMLRSSRPPNNRPKDQEGSLSLLTLFTRIKILFPYLWPSKSFGLQVLAVVCFALMLLKRFVNVFVPLFFGRVISDLSAGRPPYVNIGLYVVTSFLQDSNTMLYRYLWLPVSQYSEREMSNLSFECLLNLSLAYHTKRKVGELLRILSRSEAINDFFENLIFTFIPILIDLPVAAVVLYFNYGPLIVTVVLIVSVIFVTTSITLAESRTKMYRKLRDENVFMSQIKTDTLLNWETVKIFTAETFEANRLRTAMRVYQKGYFNVYSSWNSLSLIQDSISAFGLLVCSFVLARRVINGEMDVGKYVTFVSYLSQLYGPLNRISGLYKTVMSNLVDTEQLMELLSSDKDVVDREGAKELIVEGGGIVFKDVHFSYDGKQDTIKGISFEIPFGKSVALVGDSGGGKSTIMRLLYRFYDVTSGSISIAGTDIRDLSQKSLRENIGLVPQDSVLFNETVRYNIGYGNHTATESDVEDAARTASIHDRIMTFPDKYETRVGERGQRLSGGEKQRIAIARVILKNAPILLLDESTSALDTVNERQIQQRLREISKGRTTLTIAHRLSTIVDSDVIYVLSEGKIAESGSHSDLLLKPDGLYAALWLKQTQADSEAAGLTTEVNKKE